MLSSSGKDSPYKSDPHFHWLRWHGACCTRSRLQLVEGRDLRALHLQSENNNDPQT